MSQASGSSYWQIEVSPKSPALDGHGRAILADIRDAGFNHIESVRSSRLFLFKGNLDRDAIEVLARELLADAVAEDVRVGKGIDAREPSGDTVEVQALPGVMDPAAMSTQRAAGALLVTSMPAASVEAVRTARRYSIAGARSAAELDEIAARVLFNDCIEAAFLTCSDRTDPLPADFPSPPTRPFELRHVKLADLSDEQLKTLSRDAHLFLSLEEMRAVRDHFAALGRDATDLELETLAQTWSEHCVHKTLKSAYEYEGEGFESAEPVTLRFDNLLKDTIARATAQLNKPWCLSVFVDNAGVIALDDEYGIAFKVETHNHPSAIEPYGGAATGVGGCIRDIMGCGLGAKPIASTDVFCLASPDFDARRLPADVLHPRRVLKGVVGGVRDYGNRMGIPTVNGAIHFNDRYLANPLVFCGCVGLIPRKHIEKEAKPGDYVVVAGGRTGRDGIHGATFSSAELTDTAADEFSHAVQIGNAIEEKTLLDALLLARDHEDGCLYNAVTDCGAGGLSSAVGEMGETCGVEVDLERVPLKYAGLRYDEIWISEAQERMVFAVPEGKLQEFLDVFAHEGVEATAIGRFTGDGKLHARFEGKTVGELDMSFLHGGVPQSSKRARWTAEEWSKTRFVSKAKSSPEPGDVRERLLAELNRPTVASKEWVIRQYDHEVQGRSVIKPLAGPLSGPSDAAVVRPRYDKPTGVAIGCGLCPELSDVDPYLMALAAVDEAVRNIVCVGGDLDRTAILDNFCWPKVDDELSLGALVRTCKGAMDAALALGLPFISGKDSLNNEFSMSESESERTGLPRQLAIPPTLLISAISIIDDVSRCVTMDLKRVGSVLVLAEPAGDVRPADVTTIAAHHRRVSDLIRSGVVRSAHDVSEGGVLTALSEMCIASGLGVDLVPSSALQPFAERPSRYILEMNEPDAHRCGFPILGRVTDSTALSGEIASGSLRVSIEDLTAAWKTPLSRGGA